MLKYYLNGAWGEVPDKKLVKALQKMGIALDVTKRPDNLIDFRLNIDDEKILKNVAPSSIKKQTKEKPIDKKVATKTVKPKKPNVKKTV